jgi:periplasmic protein TonB
VSAEGLRQYRLALAREARRYKQYPPLARSRGWEGTVELRVEITAGARPSVGLARSSGHEVLDAEALEMMGRAVLLAVVPVSLQGRSFSVPVPVRFALDE